MKTCRLLPLVLTLLLAACAPTAREVPPAPEIVYNAPASKVHPVVVRAISTSPGLPNSNGWIITQNDIAGGFVTAQTVAETLNLRNIYQPNKHYDSLSVVISPNESGKGTAVITQFTSGASDVVRRIHQQLGAAFGAPTKTGTLTPSNYPHA